MKEDFYSNLPEKKYIEKTPYNERKKKGQFFTTSFIADFMAKWCLKNNKGNDFLEPGLGLGIFSRMVAKQNKNIKFWGYEIDKLVLNEAAKLFKNEDLIFTFKNKDFLLDYNEKKYDAVLCNPPYLKFHDYSNKNHLKKLENKYGLKLSKFTNIYSLFIIKSINSLKKDGKSAFIVPSEFLNSDYGIQIKKFLKNNNSLKYIINFKSDLNVFEKLEDILTTSCILLFENNKETTKVNYINIKDLDEFQMLSKKILNEDKVEKLISYNLEKLDENIKWSLYFNAKFNYDEFNKNKLADFNKFFNLKRGIATGANKYFTLSETDLKNNKIDSNADYLKLCLTKAKQINKLFFTEDDIQNLRKNDERIYLLDIDESQKYNLDKNLQNYIKKGENKKYNERYLTKKRNPWFSMEKREVPDLFVKVFNRNKLLFSKNETNAVNLTSFHCIYVKEEFEEEIDLLFSYLITDVAIELFNINKREYGGGLDKFEPNDIKKSKVIDFRIIKEKEKNKILNIYNNIKNKDKENENYKDELKTLNKIYVNILK